MHAPPYALPRHGWERVCAWICELWERVHKKRQLLQALLSTAQTLTLGLVGRLRLGQSLRVWDVVLRPTLFASCIARARGHWCAAQTMFTCGIRPQPPPPLRAQAQRAQAAHATCLPCALHIQPTHRFDSIQSFRQLRCCTRDWCRSRHVCILRLTQRVLVGVRAQLAKESSAKNRQPPPCRQQTRTM